MRRWLIYKILRTFKAFGLGLLRSLKEFFIYRLRTLIKEHYYEKRLGIETMASSPFKDDISLYRDAQAYTPIPYAVIEKMLDNLRLAPEDVFVDLGCGKGRVICTVAARRLKKVVGVEIRQDLAAMAKENLKTLKLNNTSVEIVNADVVNYDVSEGTVFFMFHPFGRQTFAKVVENIKASLVTHPRRIRIVYYSPALRDILESQDWLVLDSAISTNNTLVWYSKSAKD